MKRCINCLRGLCNTCMGSTCDCTHETIPEVVNAEPEEETRPSAGGQSRRARSLKRDDALKDQQSTGRKRAARLFPLDREAPCEWRGLKNCGGGINPINGCLDGLQQARHHGPDKSVVNNDEGNVHRICHRCLGPTMKVLTWRLNWINAANLSVGQELLGFTEQLGQGVVKYRKSIVESIESVKEPSYRFIMDNGLELISSHNHQWVASNQKRQSPKWKTTESLKEAHHLRFLVEPWYPDLSWDAGWLAGFLDGEGSLSGYTLYVGQKDSNVLEKGHSGIETYTKGAIHEIFRPARRYTGDGYNRNDFWDLRVSNLPDILRILGQVRPIRLLDEFPRFITNKSPILTPTPIKSIEYLGEQEVISIQTSTKTMFVNGFMSHNCHNRWHAANNKSYDWNSTTVHPHQPTAMSDVERWWVAAEDSGKQFKAIHD